MAQQDNPYSSYKKNQNINEYVEKSSHTVSYDRNNDRMQPKNDADPQLMRNITIAIKFFDKHYKDVQEYFNEFSNEPAELEAKVSIQDIPLILRVAFYIDNITFHSSPWVRDEYFHNRQAYDEVFLVLQQFLENEDRELDENMKIFFRDFYNFVFFFIENRPDLYIRTSEEQQEAIQDPTSSRDISKQKVTDTEKVEAELSRLTKELTKQSLSKKEQAQIQEQIAALERQLTSSQSEKQSVASSEQKRSQAAPKLPLRLRSLKRIFDFYARQKYVTGKNSTFSAILHETETITMGKFLLFCKQFSILYYKCPELSRDNLQKLFKVTAANCRELTFQEFMIILEKLAQIMFSEDQNSTELQNVERLYQFIGVDVFENFFPKLKQLSKPFNIREPPGFRLLPLDLSKQAKLRPITPDRLQKLSDWRRKKEQLKKESMAQPSKPKMLARQQQERKEGPMSYMGIREQQKEHQIQKAKPRNIIDWVQLEETPLNQLEQLESSKFNPNELFDTVDDDDERYYLKEFSLEETNRLREQEMLAYRKKLENYGNIQSDGYSSRSFRTNELIMDEPQAKLYSQQHRPSEGPNSIKLTAVAHQMNKLEQNQANLRESIKVRAQEIESMSQKREKELMGHFSTNTKTKNLQN